MNRRHNSDVEKDTLSTSTIYLAALLPRPRFIFFMNDILREHLDMTAVGILDDVIIYSEDTHSHAHPSSLPCQPPGTICT